MLALGEFLKILDLVVQRVMIDVMDGVAWHDGITPVEKVPDEVRPAKIALLARGGVPGSFLRWQVE